MIDLGLCPFAFEVFSKDKILYKELGFDDPEHLVAAFSEAINTVLDESHKATTALLIITSGLEVFDDYLAVYHSLEALLDTLVEGKHIQLASFHPQYQFDNTEEEDIENYTNRSPYPLIHILRTDEVAEAIASHPDIHSVPTHNIATMKKLGRESLQKLISEISKR